MKIQAKDIETGMRITDGYCEMIVHSIEENSFKNGKKYFKFTGEIFPKRGSSFISEYNTKFKESTLVRII